ncbi:MAG: hypothetical protein LBU18_00335 [Treponema sp.]|nr:hypothetical protein [Treponema sp.]
MYEVVFRNQEPDASRPSQVEKYYRGTGTKSDGYINVAVYPGFTYDVLLLAGSTAHQNKTLLAAGYTNGTSPIKEGVNNVINVEVKAFPPVWDTSKGNVITRDTTTPEKSENDFAFLTSALGTGYSSKLNSRNFHIAPELQSNADTADETAAVPDTATLTVQFNVVQLKALLAAEGDSSNPGAITLIPNVRLDPFSGQPPYGFTPIAFTPTTGSNATNQAEIFGVSAASTAGTGAYKFIKVSGYTSSNTSFISFVSVVSTNKLPKNNTDGLLVFELGYRAFGETASGGFLWTIRNGLNEGEDTAAAASTDTTGDTDGGSFRIKFGAGAPVKLVNTETNHHANAGW